MEGLHPVPLEQEVPIDVAIAALVAADFDAQRLLDFVLVQVIADPLELRIAQTAGILALGPDVVDVLARALVRPDHRVVAVDRRRHARPHALGLVAVLDQARAARVRVLHRLALARVQHGRPSALAARHRLVVRVLCQAVGQAVADQHRLEIDVGLLVREDLGGENGDVVAGVRLARDVEVLLGVLRELLEEESEQGVDVLAGCQRGADGASAVREAHVHRLVQENDRGVIVPR